MVARGHNKRWNVAAIDFANEAFHAHLPFLTNLMMNGISS